MTEPNRKSGADAPIETSAEPLDHRDDGGGDVAGMADMAGATADDDGTPPAEHREPGYRNKAWLQAALVTGVTGAAVTHAFRIERAGFARMLPTIGIAYLVMLVGAWRFAAARGELREQFAPRRLDLTMGALVAGVLYLITNLVPTFVLQGRPEESWLWRLYVQLGEAKAVAPPYIGVAVLVIAAIEEIVWRGWVMRALRVAHGARTALVATTLLYGLAHVGTMVSLHIPGTRPNPLLVVAALGCGFVWGAMALRFERLGPSIFAHALFSWSVALFPMWRGKL